MVDATQFKRKIQVLLAQHDIEFLGRQFDHIVTRLGEKRAHAIYKWIAAVTKKCVQPMSIGKKTSYKHWTVNQLLTFRYPFRIGNTEYRSLLVKVKNKMYIEFHLGNHAYYDTIRKQLRLKEAPAPYGV
ncbi:MAG: hypothetical protein OXR66_05070 [Candidatus Woesearchaeota archaeon]|nr:hypothetical protein [Candidatus Woesearchaeota archaeon]